MTRILAFSDLHASRRRTEALIAAGAEADLILGAGDFCNMRQGLAEALAPFAPLAEKLIAVPGNAESAEELRDAAPPGTTVLHGEATRRAGLTIFGLGYAVPITPFGAWSCDLSEKDAETLLAGVETADILLLHSPPHGVGDRTSQGQSVGSTALRAAIERVQPRLAFCGHVHDSWGVSGPIGATMVHNLGPAPTWFEL
ncbi:MAG: metallophosphoesterase [Pseudomonadota bacterium]